MSIVEQIMTTYPDLTSADFGFFGTIALQDDSDGLGTYVASWNYAKPLPDGIKVGK